MHKISRKEFLKGAAVGAGGLAFAGALGFAAEENIPAAAASFAEDYVLAAINDYMPETPGSIDAEYDCDALVIGAGGSGICCAATIAESGAKVILMESTMILGGCALVSGGNGCASFNSKLQLENGVEEADITAYCADWVHTQIFHCDAALVYNYFTSTGETTDWMVAHGIPLKPGKSNEAVSLPSKTERPAMFAALADTVVQYGGQILTDTEARSLIQDDSGKVIGAYAVNGDGENIKLNAKAVVLATGGFAANEALTRRIHGFDCAWKNPASNTGLGARMAWAIGAGIPDNVGGMMWHHSSASWPNNAFEAPMCGYPRFLNYSPFTFQVTKQGIRYKNEDLTVNFYAGPNLYEKMGGSAFILVNGDMIEKLETGGFAAIGYDMTSDFRPYKYTAPDDQDTQNKATAPKQEEPWPQLAEVLDAVANDGYGFKGETLEELCAACGMDYTILREELDRYNQYCRDGYDATMGKNPKYLFEYIDRGPWYFIEGHGVSLGTCASLIADCHLRVCKQDRNPIDGLYSCGVEAASGLYLKNYYGNTA